MVSFKWWHFGRGATQHFIIYDGGLNFVDVKAAPDRARRLIKVKTCDRNACAAIEWPTTWMETRNVQGRGHGLLGARRAPMRARVCQNCEKVSSSPAPYRTDECLFLVYAYISLLIPLCVSNRTTRTDQGPSLTSN